jgi:ABC-type transporter Mla maintaining outer membrane lipid asymmetry ATPase subunit MlaF
VATLTGLELDRASFRYGELWVLRETTLSVARGGNLAVTGDNGVGKSTFLYVCAGLFPATSGRVLLAGQAPGAMRPSELFRSGVRRGVVFYTGGLLSNSSALNNVMLPLRYHSDVLGLDDAAIDRRARELLAELRVSQSDFHALPAHLSVGVRRRVSMARALAIQPNFLFFDDPDANLDSATRRLVYDLLERFRDDTAVTMVLTTTSRELLERLDVSVRELAHGHLFERTRGHSEAPA